MLASPPTTFNMMSDARTAADMQMAGGQVDSNFTNSVMRNFMSPNGKYRADLNSNIFISVAAMDIQR